MPNAKTVQPNAWKYAKFAFSGQKYAKLATLANTPSDHMVNHTASCLGRPHGLGRPWPAADSNLATPSEAADTKPAGSPHQVAASTGQSNRTARSVQHCLWPMQI